ncbi:MAG TPA: Uma2 family endonuclease [Polyangiales bacterium]|nr:Uma2 family endonuclease [Polyangiales bacterium]
MASGPPLATYADLLALPDDVRGEVLSGQIVTSRAELPRHAHVQRAVGSFVGGPFDDDDGRGGPGGWWIFFAVDVGLGPHDFVRPDLAGWRRERLPHPADLRPIEVVPDWICEISSPSSVARDRVHKRDLYARAGVSHYWLVDPDARVLEAFALRGGVWIVAGSYDEQRTARIPPFEAVELEVARFFFPSDPAQSSSTSP